MANDVETAMSDGLEWACNRANKRKTRHLKLFLARDPLDRILMDTFSPLSKTINGEQFTKIVTD